MEEEGVGEGERERESRFVDCCPTEISNGGRNGGPSRVRWQEPVGPVETAAGMWPISGCYQLRSRQKFNDNCHRL